MAPPLRAQTVSPALLIARETGNSPPLPTGLPIILRLVGLAGSILKTEMVLEPALTVARILPAADVLTAPWVKSASGPLAPPSSPWPPRPPVLVAVRRFYEIAD